MKNLYQVASWITLLNGIREIDQVCDRRGLNFDDVIKPERLEEYVTSRKEDVLHVLREMQQETKYNEKQMVARLSQLPIATLVDVVNEYASKPHYEVRTK